MVRGSSQMRGRHWRRTGRGDDLGGEKIMWARVGDGQRRSGEGGEAEGARWRRQGGDKGEWATEGTEAVWWRVRRRGTCRGGLAWQREHVRRGWAPGGRWAEARWQGRGGDSCEVATVGRAREEGGAGAAVHDVAEARHGMDWKTPKAIHAEIEKYDHVAHARRVRVPLDC